MDIIKKEWSVILLALIVGFLTGYPQLLAIEKLGNDFRGIYQINSSDELYYLVWGQEAIDGHYYLANPYIYEHKGGPPFQFWIPAYILARGSELLSLSLPQVYIAYDFFLPAILVLLTYLVIRLLTENRLLSLSGTILLHLGIFFNIFNRPISPQFNFIFFLSLFIFLVAYLKKRKNVWLILACFNLGLLFYIYPYYWTYYFTLLPLFAIINYLFLKNKLTAKNIALVIILAFLIAIPYFVQVYQNLQVPFYNEVLKRLGMINSYFPSGPKIILPMTALLLIFGLFWQRGLVRLEPLSIFLVLAVISTGIVTNQHILTGKNIELASHYLLLSVFIFIFAGLYLIERFLKEKGRTLLPAVFFLLVTILSLSQALTVFDKQKNPTPSLVSWQRYGPLLVWFRENTELDEVVFASAELSAFIPAYTHNNVFYVREANMHLMSDQEVIRRFIINNYFQEPLDRKFLLENERSIWGVFYINRDLHFQLWNKIRKALGLSEKILPRFPEDEIKKIILLASEIKKLDFQKVISSYRIDYLVWDTRKNPEWKLNKIMGLEKVNRIEEFEIYKLRNESK